jgi:hypothetical protein
MRIVKIKQLAFNSVNQDLRRVGRRDHLIGVGKAQKTNLQPWYPMIDDPNLAPVTQIGTNHAFRYDD